MKRSAGSLVAVGIGIRSPAQATFESAARIKNADKVFVLVPDPVAHYWIGTLNANVESLGHLYAEGKNRSETYRQIVERITDAVREGLCVCVVSYGHPGVAAFPFHESIRILRAEGYAAEMLAGVSSADCLFSELGVDPIVSGCLSYEATDFLLRRRVMDPACNLILWQIGVIAVRSYHNATHAWNRAGLAALRDRLLEAYAPEHVAVIYESPFLIVGEPTIERTAIGQLPDAPVTTMSTLFVPPVVKAPTDETMATKLGLATTVQ
jgi:precorrin-3B methylase